jgi:putative aldouronate transport system substrate-binding protein
LIPKLSKPRTNLSPTAKRWFKKLNEEYKKGIIDQECFLLNSDQYYQKIRSGRVLGMVDQQWNFNSAASELPADCTYIPLGITIDEGITDHYRDRPAFNNSAGVGISISCDDPEAAVKFLNDLLDPEIQNLRSWGIEGVDYFVNEDGLFDQTEEQYVRWRDDKYRETHECMYDYMPYWQGMAPDGINAYNSSNQPNIYYKHIPEPVKKCFDAYGIQTYTGMLADPGENSRWYPMWSFSNSVTDDTDYGKVMKQIDTTKRKYLPLLVMSSDFEKTWTEYVDVYGKLDSQIYFNELTAEVKRRVEAWE